jgi:hypothetical protein
LLKKQVAIQHNHQKTWMLTFVGMANQEMPCRVASFRRKPESGAEEWQSTGCAERLQKQGTFSPSSNT